MKIPAPIKTVLKWIEEKRARRSGKKETDYLLSIPGMKESILEGMNEDIANMTKEVWESDVESQFETLAAAGDCEKGLNILEKLDGHSKD